MLKKLFGWGKQESKREDLVASRFGVDLSMSYCPSCGDEYRAGVGSCHSCEVELVSGEERLAGLMVKDGARRSRTMDISENDQLVPIRGGKLRDLKPLQAILAAETVPALLIGEQGGCGKG